MRDGAAIRRPTGTRERKNHPVGFIRELRVLGGNPWVGAVAEHRVLPELRAGAVGEGEGLVVVVDVGVAGFAWGEVEDCMLVLYFVSFFGYIGFQKGGRGVWKLYCWS